MKPFSDWKMMKKQMQKGRRSILLADNNALEAPTRNIEARSHAHRADLGRFDFRVVVPGDTLAV